MTLLPVGLGPCRCSERHSASPSLVVVTGGPGAGKTAVLTTARHLFCRHVAFVPEAAGLVYGGGFPRGDELSERRAAQRAIYHVQVALQELLQEDTSISVALLDRGTVDGVAYWPGSASEYWEAVGTTGAIELARYATVIHLDTPLGEHGYNHANPLRVESVLEAQRINDRIVEAWSSHPRRFIVPCEAGFAVKSARALELLSAEIHACSVNPSEGK